MRRSKIIFPLCVLAWNLAAQEHPAQEEHEQPAPEQPGARQVPPLIDRELLFGNPEIAAAQISPDGQYLAFLKPWKDTRNVWVKSIREPFSAARLLTTETKRPVGSYLWTRDGKYVCYVKDNQGDENFNLYAVDPSAAAEQGAAALQASLRQGAEQLAEH